MRSEDPVRRESDHPFAEEGTMFSISRLHHSPDCNEVVFGPNLSNGARGKVHTKRGYVFDSVRTRDKGFGC